MTEQEATSESSINAALPRRLFGLTVDAVRDAEPPHDPIADHIVESLETIKQATGRLPVVRFVFDVDEGHPDAVDPEYYRVIKRIKDNNLAYIMGQLWDSSYVKYCRDGNRISESCYLKRTENYLTALGDLVDLWEVGNEMNGEWVGNSNWEDEAWTAEDMRTIRDTYASAVGKAHEFLQRAGKATALTFYFNDDGVRHSWTDMTKRKDKMDAHPVRVGPDHNMLTWAEHYKQLFPGTNYVFISSYEDDQFADEPRTGRRTRIIPSPDQWAYMFKRLHDFYPSARLGFGEMGAQCYYLLSDSNCVPQENNEDFEKIKANKKCGNRRCPCCLNAQRDYINRYYVTWNRDIPQRLDALVPGLGQSYVGGYFYWYFNSDVINKMVKSSKASTPANEKTKLRQEATDTLNSLIAAFRSW